MCAGTVESSGVFDFENDQAIYQGSYCGGSLLRNTGLVRKSGGNGTNQLTSVPLVNTGTLEVKQGWIGYSSGSFFATGTQFLGSGTNLLNSGSVTFDGTIVSSNAELAGGVLYGTNLLLGQMRWTGGNIDNSARVTIGASSQLEISGGRQSLGGTLRNEGVVRLTGAAALGMCAGTVDNAGVFELENDQPVWLGAYCGGSIFINSGVLRKSGGAATNRFASVPLANTGILEIQQGSVSYSSGSVFNTGTQFLGVGTNLLNQGDVWLRGSIVSANVELAGANLLGTNTVQGVLRSTGGNIDHSARVTIGASSQLEISGEAAGSLGGALRNEGVVRLTAQQRWGCAPAQWTMPESLSWKTTNRFGWGLIVAVRSSSTRVCCASPAGPQPPVCQCATRQHRESWRLSRDGSAIAVAACLTPAPNSSAPEQTFERGNVCSKAQLYPIIQSSRVLSSEPTRFRARYVGRAETSTIPLS